MAKLEVRLLGGFEVVLDGRLVTEFESTSTRALLARLSVAPTRRIARAELAELIWPDRPAGSALANLRHSLAVIRRAIGDHDRERPVLAADRDSIFIDPGTELRIDVAEFERLARTPPSAAGAVAAWEAAVALRRGQFLAGFSSQLSEQWDTWLLMTRARVDAIAVQALVRLADIRARTGEHPLALGYAREALAIDPWSEPAHALVIRLLALDGQAAAALEHAESYAAELTAQLGVEPGPAVREAVDEARAGRPTAQAIEVPWLPPRSFAMRPAEPCVGRDEQLAWLHRRLEDAAGGAGGVVFVSGVAGSGKTVLLRAFADEARDRMPALCVLGGAGNSYTGAGDPFLPFRQILAALCGDLEPGWTRGSLTRAEASRLWAALPAVVETVLDLGPYLLGTLIDASALGNRFDRGYPDHPLCPRLAEAVAAAVRRADDPMRQRWPILDQCALVLTHLARQRPMLLLIDDLHWADVGTIDLVGHLTRQLGGVPLLLVLAFRPRDGSAADAPDAIALMVSEARAQASADCSFELTGSRAFVDAWLDRDPNLLGEDFRARLFRATGGHALFTVETTAGMRQRGDLAPDDHGRWTASAAIAWDELPPRVEASIAMRTAQLPAELRRDLEVASVQGETFATDLLAEVRHEPIDEVVRRVNALAVSPHALVEPAGVERIRERRVDRYRFRHALIRQYLHDHLPPAERVALHGATGRALATRHAERLDDVAIELAAHFDAAGLVDEAIEHHGRAGRRAMRLSATSEAIVHFERALALVCDVDPSPDRDRVELALLTPFGACLQAHAGYTAPQTSAAYERIRELISVVGTTFESAQALGSLTTVDGLLGRYGAAIDDSERLLEIAADLGLPPIEAVAHTQLGWLLLMTGRLVEALGHLDRAVEMYDDEWDQWLPYAVGLHVPSVALAWRAVAAWQLGRPDQARRDAATSLAAARRIGYPFAQVFALAVAGCAVSAMLGDAGAVVASADEEAAIADREDFAFYRAAALVHRGLGLAWRGDVEEGLREADAGFARWSEFGTEAFMCWLRSMQAERLVDAGRIDAASKLVGEIDERLRHGEEQLVAYLVPLTRAAVQRARGDDAGAEATLRSAIALQGRHGALGPQLRAATALAELLCDDGRPGDALAVLAPVLAAFTEGADDVDVRRGRGLLRAIG